MAVAVLVAECLVAVEHAGGERAGIDGWVLAPQQPCKPVRVGEDGAGEPGLASETVQSAPGFAGGWSGQGGVLVAVDHRE